MIRVNRYANPSGEICDFRTLPRPLFSLATVLRGSVDFEEDGRVSHVESGDCIFVPMHARYLSRWYDAEIMTCHFTLPEDCAPIRGKRFPVQKVEHPLAAPSIRRLMELQSDDQRSFDLLACFYQLCAAVFPTLNSTDAPPLSPRIRTAAAYIEAHYRETIHVEALAALCGMSASHLYSCFRQETGMSPIAFKQRIAITAAEQLLAAQDDLSVEAVSERVGFQNASYFRRVFRSLTGCSPREYRKRQNRV